MRNHPSMRDSLRNRFRSKANRQSLRRWLLRSLLATTLGCSMTKASAWAQSSNESSDDEGVVYWPRPDFVIPFNVDVTGQAPREIQLELSEDGGRTWSLYSRSDVRTRQFQFQAASDGEYQFRLKTLDSRGRTFDNPGEPLRVVVDTTKPEAELRVAIDERGVMLAAFSIRDSAIDTSTIQLTYHTETISQSREIQFDLTPGRASGEWIGRGSWNIPEGTKLLSVRLTAKDKAGNPVEVTKLPQLPLSAALNTGLQLASGRTRDGVGVRQANSQPIGSGLANPPSDSLPKVQVLSGPGARANSGIDPKFASQLMERQQELIEQQKNLINHQQSANNLLAAEGRVRTNATRSNEDLSPQEFNSMSLSPRPEAFSSEPKTPENADLRRNRKAFRQLTPEEAEQLSAPKSMSLASKRGDQSVLTRDNLSATSDPTTGTLEIEPTIPRASVPTQFHRNIKPLYSSSKTFSLDYNIENDPESPVASVELWGTTDEGQTWQMWGQDPDRASPFDIQVESEGLFGFRMIIVGANGLASNRPRNGDNADAWIHVDTQSPQLKLISALYGKGSEAGCMIIEYKATDDYFPERPIALFYSETPEGPWISIASGARNNGRYVWPADPSLPPSIYLRVQAFDAAGNVSTSQSEFPIDVQGLAPRGRIQGFRPIK